MRAHTAGFSAALASDRLVAAELIEGEFSSGTLRLASTPYALSALGYEWLGAGNLLAIEPVRDTLDLSAQGCRITLSGVNLALVAVALDSGGYQGRPVRRYLALFDETTGALVTDPALTWAGRMDRMTLSIGDTATMSLECESTLATWDRPRSRRYNSADQNVAYPDDRGLDFVEALQDRQIAWGWA